MFQWSLVYVRIKIQQMSGLLNSNSRQSSARVVLKLQTGITGANCTVRVTFAQNTSRSSVISNGLKLVLRRCVLFRARTRIARMCVCMRECVRIERDTRNNNVSVCCSFA